MRLLGSLGSGNEKTGSMTAVLLSTLLRTVNCVPPWADAVQVAGVVELLEDPGPRLPLEEPLGPCGPRPGIMPWPLSSPPSMSLCWGVHFAFLDLTKRQPP